MIYYIHFHSATSEQDNKKVLDVVKSFPGWAIITPSFYFVRVDDKSKDETKDTNLLKIKEKLKAVTTSNDEFFIGQLGNEATWQGFGGRLKAWLVANSRYNEENDSFKREIEKPIEDTREDKTIPGLPGTPAE